MVGEAHMLQKSTIGRYSIAGLLLRRGWRIGQMQRGLQLWQAWSAGAAGRIGHLLAGCWLLFACCYAATMFVAGWAGGALMLLLVLLGRQLL